MRCDSLNGILVSPQKGETQKLFAFFLKEDINNINTFLPVIIGCLPCRVFRFTIRRPSAVIL